MAVVIDPNYAELFKENGRPFGEYSSDLATFRIQANANMSSISQALPYPEGMQETTHSTTSADGTSFAIHRFLPKPVREEDKSSRHRAVVFAFGGGMISGSVEVARGVIAALAQRSHTQVFAPEYRIAPEHPAPAGIEDVYATVEWLQANAERFDVDPGRIVLFGLSAGGGVVAGTALMARDKGLTPRLAGQCLRYPMLDDRTTMAESDPRSKYLTWPASTNEMGWKYYLGGRKGHASTGLGKILEWLASIATGKKAGGNIPPYAVPARAKDLRGLPPTHIGVGGLDLFKDEDAAYAEALAKADVGVEFHMYPGVPHGFEAIPPIKIGEELWHNEARWIMKF
ncbi:Alpha/Beta hydrolase protein [Hypomontagnella submonticulosa]|nr:Alpha/Beta hydrolase protein [Hypomontagnella submonticulosa]